MKKTIPTEVRAFMVDSLGDLTCNQIKEDILVNDLSVLHAMATGNGFKQFDNLSDEELSSCFISDFGGMDDALLEEYMTCETYNQTYSILKENVPVND